MVLKILAQVFGLISLVILAISLHKKKKSDLLSLQVLSNLSSSAQYFLLGAFSGGLIHLLCVARNLVFKKYKHVPTSLILAFLALVFFVTFLSYSGPVSLLPAASISIYTFAIARGSLKQIRLLDIVACLIAIVYNILVGAYVAILVSVVEILSAATALLRYDFKPNKKASPKRGKR